MLPSYSFLFRFSFDHFLKLVSRFFFAGPFLCSNHEKNTPRSYRAILACCRRACTTAQRSVISREQSSEARTCRSECENASKQTGVGKSQRIVEHLQLAVFSKPTKKSKYARPKKTNHKQLVMREAFNLTYFHPHDDTTLFFFPFVHICMILIHACGVRVVFLEHGALGICKTLACT